MVPSVFDQRVLDVFRNYVDPSVRSTVGVDSHLRRDLGLSSYDYMALLDELESEMRVEVDIDAIMHAQTIADIIQAVGIQAVGQTSDGGCADPSARSSA